MKIFTKGILCALAFLVCFSCGQGESAAVDNMEKKAPVKLEKTKKKSDNNRYWGALKNELSLDGKKLNKVRQLVNKNTRKVSVISEAKADNYLEQIKKIRLSEKEEVKNILGDELFQKKLDFDKTWAKNAPAPKGRKRPAPKGKKKPAVKGQK